MTKSRTSTGRLLLGVLGTSPHGSKILREWNRSLREAGIDGSMDRYPCTVQTLPERLSEMVHFDRRGYIVVPALQAAILPLMDHVDSSAQKAAMVDTVLNDGGVLFGYFLGNDDHQKATLWMNNVNSHRLV